MRDGPSRTAEWVAFSRTIGRKLPADARIVDDPYGALFAGPRAAAFAEHAPAILTLPFWPTALYMQVRTRAIDDVLTSFLVRGGTQIVILGAGYDCRAIRFERELATASLFEVDHPATQAKKRSTLEAHRVHSAARYFEWDFEHRSVAELPRALEAAGLDPQQQTLTIWEGVTMYLSEAAIDATVRAVRGYSAPGSPLSMTYLDRAEVERPSGVRKFVTRMVARAGEPFRFGWPPAELAAWFEPRGFHLEWDRSTPELARALLPPQHARTLERWSRSHHLALLN